MRASRRAPKRWQVVRWRGDRTIHVTPEHDLREHTERVVWCWCDPEVERVGPRGDWKVVHNSMDGRELVERHGLM